MCNKLSMDVDSVGFHFAFLRERTPQFICHLLTLASLIPRPSTPASLLTLVQKNWTAATAREVPMTIHDTTSSDFDEKLTSSKHSVYSIRPAIALGIGPFDARSKAGDK